MKVKICQPIRNAMQSGKENRKYWILEPIKEKSNRQMNHLMNGWVESDNTKTQISIRFKNQESAVKYAEQEGFEYIVQEATAEKIKNKSYASNFTKPVLS